MAFLISAALVGLAALTDKGVSQEQFEYRPQEEVPKRRKPMLEVTAPKLQIEQGPLYDIPAPDFVTADNERIARQLIEVEATSKLFNDRNKAQEAQDPEIKKLLGIVTDFIRDKKLIIYGGSALSALLPPADKFYDYSKEIPDYDFFSSNAQEDSMELADRFYAAGYKDTQARSGVHLNTFKVSGSFTQLADISQLPVEIMEQMDVVKTEDGLLVAGPLYLRIDLYKQLAEQNQPDRWPKVWKRMQLLNRNYPMPCMQESLKPMLCISAQRLPNSVLTDAVISFIESKRGANPLALPIVGSTLPELYERLEYKLSPELKAQLNNFRCVPKEVAAIDLFSTTAKADAIEFTARLQAQFPDLQFKIITGPLAHEIFSERWIVTTQDGSRLVEFLLPDKCLAITNVNGTYFGNLDTVLAVMFSKLFVDGKIVKEPTRGKQLCLMQYLMDAITLNAKYGADSGEFARFPATCYGPVHTLREVFEERWHQRVARMIAKHKAREEGKPIPEELGAPMFSYRPHDIALAREGKIDQRMAEIDLGQGKMSMI